MINLSISAVIPVYNEEKYLPKTMREVHSILAKNFVDFEIIFVNDGSTDRSSYILSNFQKDYPCVKVLNNYTNQGLGTTLRKGFAAAVKEVIFYIDCDLPANPVFVVEAVPFLITYDIVIGHRDRWDNLLRKACSRIYNFIICYPLHLNISDINFGVKVFKRELLKSIKLESLGSFIDAEFLVKAKINNFSIKEIPCFYCKRSYGRSKLSNIRNVMMIIIDILRYYFCKKGSAP